jgi:putative oxidoreductase
MKVTSTIARYLLGIIFLVFGLNGFLHFIPMPLPPGVAGQFFMALGVSHYFAVVFLLQLVAAVLLLAGRYVPLALAIIAPVVVNILCYHTFMAPSGLPMAVILLVLWLFSVINVRSAFAGLFQKSASPRVPTETI